jgi:hypothetical protein
VSGGLRAPTLNRLASRYGLATQYYAITHPSGPNYVTPLAGGTFTVNSDDRTGCLASTSRALSASWTRRD